MTQNGYHAVFTNTLPLLIEPLDTLFFRDGRPFQSGMRAWGGFPPPQTLAGMIRSHVMQESSIDPKGIHNLRGTDSDHEWFSHLAVRGPWLAKHDRRELVDIYTPPPANLRQEKESPGKKDSHFHFLAPLHPDFDLPGWKSPHHDYDMRPLLSRGASGKLEPVDGFLNKGGLKKVLEGETPDPSEVKQGEDLNKLYQFEDRTGIGIDAASQTASEGLIYSVRHLRLKEGIVFYAEVGLEGDEESLERIHSFFPKEGITLPFGGEGRRVRITPLKNGFQWPKAPETPSPDKGGYTTLLISPTILIPREDSKGEAWHPPNIGKLTGAAIGRPRPISGWDMSKQQGKSTRQGLPKPTRYAVEAGGIYFWQDGRKAEGTREHPDLYQLAHTPKERSSGWGTALRGIWHWTK